MDWEENLKIICTNCQNFSIRPAIIITNCKAKVIIFNLETTEKLK